MSVGSRKLRRVGRIRETAGGLALTLPSVALNVVLVYVVIVGFGLFAAGVRE